MHKLRLGRAGTARAPFKIDYRSFVVKLDKFLYNHVYHIITNYHGLIGSFASPGAALYPMDTRCAYPLKHEILPPHPNSAKLTQLISLLFSLILNRQVV